MGLGAIWALGRGIRVKLKMVRVGARGYMDHGVCVCECVCVVVWGSEMVSFGARY